MQPFSFVHEFHGFEPVNRQVRCYMTHTNADVHKVVLDNLDQLPIMIDNSGGRVKGPRYCPSIEKKLERFAEKDSHLVWLEPEGLSSNLVYPNGLTTGLPFHLQQEMFAQVPGLAGAKLAAPGYIVEYDFIDPQQVIKHSLETRQV